jgi:hypothetical protein
VRNVAQKELSSADTFDVDLDEYVSCAEAFKRLKGLVESWLEDVCRGSP